MDRPWSILGRALRDAWDEMFILVLCNLLWAVACLLVIPGPPATAALFCVTNQVAQGRFAKVADFWQALKQYFLEGWKWGLLNLVAIYILVYAAYFYNSGFFPEPYGFILAVLSLLLLAGWLSTQLFAFPFWLEQSDRRIGLALRNALVLQAQNPLLMGMIVLLVIAVGVLTGMFVPLIAIITPSFLTLVGNTVVVAKVEALRPDEE
jgi:uncharacterized membrane protein YesL